MSNHKQLSLCATLAAVSILSSCGSDTDYASAPVPVPVQGIFLDAAVEGLDFTTYNGSKGTTDAKGLFSCDISETISFTLGGINFGTAACKATITPLDLVKVTDIKDERVINRLVALQLLDEDKDPSNGIKVTNAVKTALAAHTLDLNAPAANFHTAMIAALAKLPANYKTRSLDESRRLLASEHFENTLNATLNIPTSDTISQTNPLGNVSATLTRYQIKAPHSAYITYEGTDPAIIADFPLGFLPSYGSGLTFKGKAADGSLEFYAITDRRPNGDGPKVPNSSVTAGLTGTSDGKFFPSPSFTPSIGVIALGKDGATLKSTWPIKFASSSDASGLPIAAGKVGSSGEVPLNDAARYVTAGKAIFSDNGIDPESIVLDTARNALWVSDEYGPFILKIDISTGIILKKYQPGAGATDLPAILAKRRANRGMEGLSLDTATGKLHGFLQSPLDDGKTNYLLPGAATTTNESIKDYAKFARWVEFNPTTETTKLYAYPIDSAPYSSGKTGNAKMVDLVSLGNDKFIVIEQGTGANGQVFNNLVLVQIPANATDIAQMSSDLEKSSMSGTTIGTANYSSVVTLKKTLLLDLNKANWIAEKAEGLALVDENTLALTNDGDFGLKTLMFDPIGSLLDGLADITKCTVDANGMITTTASATAAGCTAGNTARISRGPDTERPNRLWIIKFSKKLSEFTIPN